MEIIDFHNHHIPSRFQEAVVRAAPPHQRARWQALARKLTDPDLLHKNIREGHLNARVVNMSPALFADQDRRVPHATIMELNDDLAELVSRHPGRIYGLASVDAYDGDQSAREVERSIRDLGLRGVFVDCARGGLMLDAPHARPTLEVAAKLGVPVFAHPVAPQPLVQQMVPFGQVGNLFARGTANSASLVALVEGEVLARLPNLRVVVTALALGGLATIAALSRQSLHQVFMDTNIAHPALLRAAVDLLGVGNVIAGSDWPINDDPMRRLLVDAMRRAGLSETEQQAIAATNCRRLLGLDGPARP